MTIEFRREPTDDEARPPSRFEVRAGLPWAVPLALVVVACFLPVTTAHIAPDGADAAGGSPVAFRVDLYPFGRVHVARLGLDTGSGAPYGWLWVAVAAGLVVAAALAAVRPRSVRPWSALVGLVAAAAGVGGVGTLLLESWSAQAERATQQALGAGSWLVLAAGVLGVVLGAYGSGGSGRRVQSSSASANAGG